jgi:electron transfer flavoprotein beta subunit
MTIAVCWKWLAEGDDERWAGVSPADEAALELALRLADARGDTVTVLTAGAPGAARGLRAALAVGAARAVRIDAPDGLRSDAVADALASVLMAARPDLVLCGDYSLDRGSGSVPALLAAALGARQALGVVELDPRATGAVHVVRRLDGGRREELSVEPCAVISVEGSVARVRRASLAAELAVRSAPIEVVAGPRGPVEEPVDVRPYRPRARVLPAPVGPDSLARVRALTTATDSTGHGEVVVAEPADAAARIVAALQEWGYLDPGAAPSSISQRTGSSGA